MKRIFAVALTALVCSSCGSIVSRAVLKDVDRAVTVADVQSSPERLVNSRVIWGGTIIKTTNLEETTVIEVLETPLTRSDRPAMEGSGGRFLIKAPGYLDPVVFGTDKMLTIVGTVKGVEKRMIGDMEYPYPVLTPVDIHIFSSRMDRDYAPYPPWWYYPPPYYGPYYNPYYYPYPRYP